MTPELEGRVKDIRRLLFAIESITQAKQASGMIYELGSEPTMVKRSILCAAIATLYAAPFVEADYADVVPKFGRFDDEDLQSTHQSLIEARHNLYAHRGLKDNISGNHAIQVIVGEDGNIRLKNDVIFYKNKDLKEFEKIFDFQLNRLNAAARNSLESLGKIANAKPGIYTLGKDFP
jgi:hypothetical protein